MSELVPCTSCRRHARAGAACPFCGGRVVDAKPRRAAPRVARNELLALALGAAGLVGCGASSELPNPPVDAAADGADASDAAFDTAELPDTLTPAPDFGPPDDDGGPVPIYGAAPSP